MKERKKERRGKSLVRKVGSCGILTLWKIRGGIKKTILSLSLSLQTQFKNSFSCGEKHTLENKNARVGIIRNLRLGKKEGMMASRFNELSRVETLKGREEEGEEENKGKKERSLQQTGKRC